MEGSFQLLWGTNGSLLMRLWIVFEMRTCRISTMPGNGDNTREPVSPCDKFMFQEHSHCMRPFFLTKT